MNNVRKVFLFGLAALLAVVFLTGETWAAPKSDFQAPKEYGVYAKVAKGMKRILPNIVFDEEGVLYVETNNPQHFALNDIKYFIIYGKYDTTLLTLNNLLFFQASPLGRARFIFGKDMPIEVTKKGDGLYMVKPKGLFGRGYYAVWINDSAWDFIID